MAGPAAGDQEPLPLRLREEFVCFAGDRVHRRFAGHLHVTAQRKRADPVVGVALSESDQSRPKAYGEGFDLDFEEFRDQEMAQFVNDNDDSQNQECDDNA